MGRREVGVKGVLWDGTSGGYVSGSVGGEVTAEEEGDYGEEGVG